MRSPPDLLMRCRGSKALDLEKACSAWPSSRVGNKSRTPNPSAIPHVIVWTPRSASAHVEGMRPHSDGVEWEDEKLLCTRDQATAFICHLSPPTWNVPRGSIWCTTWAGKKISLILWSTGNMLTHHQQETTESPIQKWPATQPYRGAGSLTP